MSINLTLQCDECGYVENLGTSRGHFYVSENMNNAMVFVCSSCLDDDRAHNSKWGENNIHSCIGHHPVWYGDNGEYFIKEGA